MFLGRRKINCDFEVNSSGLCQESESGNVSHIQGANSQSQMIFSWLFNQYLFTFSFGAFPWLHQLILSVTVCKIRLQLIQKTLSKINVGLNLLYSCNPNLELPSVFQGFYSEFTR